MENGFDVLRKINVETKTEVFPDISFAETVKASLTYKYAPIVNRFNEARLYPEQPEEGYRAIDQLNSGPEHLKQYSSTLLRATNQEHYDYLLSTIDQSANARRDLHRSGIIPQFGAEVFDAVNWMGIPFARVGSFTQSALRGGTATAAVVGMQEGIRYPFDPLATKEEVALNIGASFVMGGLITGLVTIPAQRRMAAMDDGTKEFKSFSKSTEKKEPKADADGSIAPSVFTDSWLFKAVTTPMKRVLQSKLIPNSVKMTTLKIANDSGILLAMNRNNQNVGSSVHQNSKQFEGEWAVLQTELMPLWGQSTGKGVTTAFDYTLNISGFERWLENIDKKAIRGEKAANDLEAQTMDKMNTFYKNWETRLNEQGLLLGEKHE